MCGVKLVDKRNTEELMNMLGLKEAKDVSMKAMVREVDGKRKQGRPRMKWREQVERSMRRIGLKKKDAADRCRRRKGVRRVAEVVGCIRPPPVTGIKPD